MAKSRPVTEAVKEKSGSAAKATPASSVPGAGSLGNPPNNGPGAAEPAESEGEEEAEAQVGDLDFQAAQQRWMWQNQMQGFMYNPYGNFVPSYALGAGPLPTYWDEEEGEPTQQVPVTRRAATHEISEDEDDSASSGSLNPTSSR